MVGAKLSKPALAAVRRIRDEKRFTTFIASHGINAKSARKMAKGKYVAKRLVNQMVAALKVDATAVLLIRPASMELIETIVCTGYGFTAEALHKPRQSDWHSEAKQAAYLMAVEMGRMKPPEIALHFGVHRTAVIDGLKRIKGREGVEEILRERVTRIRSKLQAATL